MRNFFFFSLIYTACAVGLVMLLRDEPASLLGFVLIKSLSLAASLGDYLKYLGIVLLAILWVTRHSGLKNRLTPAVYAFMGCLVFSAGFSLVKTSIPFINPFWADPLMADLDAMLHRGDPWVLAHALSEHISAGVVVLMYFGVWTLPAIFLPLIIAVTDGDTARQNRFLILHLICWVGLGNVMAAGFASAGPIYYDALLGGARFAGLTDALVASGITDSKLGAVQATLWENYAEKAQAIGSGISAFPSVHVGVSTVFALYLAERSRWLAPLGLAFLGTIQFCSVYNGWHYAVDGYASMAVMTLAWWALRKRENVGRNVAFATYNPA